MHSVILKNDAVGDLVHSLTAINNIISTKSNKKITLFLSKLSQNFSFLVNDSRVDIKILNYHLKVTEKIKLIFFLIKNKVSKVYILSPKGFYFYLPLLFWRIKFYAICVNGINNYKRPNSFLRKFLFKFEINDRARIFKRESTKLIQNKLTSENNINLDFNFTVNIKKSKKLIKYLPEKYIYFHYKKKICDELDWSSDELQLLFNEFSKYCNNIIITRDIISWDQTRGEINTNKNNLSFKNIYNSYDFKSDKFISNKSNVLLFDNIVGEDLFNVIKYAHIVVSFHGMMTNLASLLKKPVLDLWHCRINSWEDYRKYRNAFYEFKPKYKDYDFTTPKKSIKKTINKIKFSLKKCQTNA